MLYQFNEKPSFIVLSKTRMPLYTSTHIYKYIVADTNGGNIQFSNKLNAQDYQNKIIYISIYSMYYILIYECII